MSSCTLCPRNCGVDRTQNTGICGANDKIKIARASLHLWEEPCISGENGSGTVFFSGCNLSCVYCQNKKISHENFGITVDKARLCEIFFELKMRGVHNINLVTASHFLPDVLSAVELAKRQNIGIPFVYNTSSYERVDALKMCEGLIDIFLPDFKYIESDSAKKYSNAPDYPETAMAAIDEMVRQQGTPQFDEDGMMTKGVIVRHLMLPGRLKESKKVIKYLYEKYKDNIFLSIMNQYTPVGNLDAFPELCRKVNDADYEELIDYAVDLGVENAFIQEGGAAEESFIPDFDGYGVIREV